MIEREWERELLDALSIYSKEIGKIPLLTPEQELELVELRDQKRWAETRLKELEKDGLKPEERKELESLITQGKQARKTLAASNVRLVRSIANRYVGLGMSRSDLIQEGNVGLMRAVDKFEPHREAKFSTYAFFWIRQAIVRALPRQGRTIRLPVHVNEELIQLKKKKIELTGELGREPNPKELAEELGWEEEKAKRILNVPETVLSLDMPIGEDKDSYLGELIEDEKTISPPKAATREMIGKQVREAVNSLTPREAKVLSLRFGLKDGISWTLEEVGKEMGVTRERIRQIEAQALRKLRHPLRARKLRDFLR